MPELPEVETVRRDLADALRGRVVERASFHHPRTVRRQSPESLAGALEGRTLVDFDRIGKFLLVGLDDGAILVVHLRMSGALFLAPRDGERAPHTHAVLVLSGDEELRFVDPRTFGELFSTRLGPGGRPPELAALGPDPLRDGLETPALRSILAKRRAAVKTVLLNQHLVAGIGNIYGDEICFRAGVRPTRAAGRLRTKEIDALSAAIHSVLTEAVELRGSTLGDRRYTDLAGAPGRFQERHAVYARVGQPCPRCGRPIVRQLVGGRSAHFCAACQR